MPLSPEPDTAEDILTFLDFHAELHCDLDDCPNIARYQIICACAEGAELICLGHAVMLRAKPTQVLVFDGSCQHTVRVEDCSIEVL